jgi:CxxC motif-containing protein (DUF1111 family)
MRRARILAIAAALAATGALAAGDLDAELGRALFERNWIPAPASTDSTDGLGPLFSARSCAGCHVGPAFAARFTPTPDGRIAGRGLVARFGDEHGNPDPTYGHLLQTQAVQGMLPEGRIILSASADGDDAHRSALHLDQGELDPATRVSFRLAPPLMGRALLDQVDADAVMALADPDDHDGDGISGRMRMVESDGEIVLGRYGWKAATPTLHAQVADAFAQDMGLSSPLRPVPHGDCTSLQAECLAATTGESARFDGHELPMEIIELVTAYLGALPGTSETPDDAEGTQLFDATGCAACHAPNLPLNGDGTAQVYTDLLLHDMGQALDDGVGEPGAPSAEWRTAPLIAMAGGEGRRYLHDGRAPDIDTAIRAHGGEAKSARSAYLALDEEQRRALLKFVESL